MHVNFDPPQIFYTLVCMNSFIAFLTGASSGRLAMCSKKLSRLLLFFFRPGVFFGDITQFVVCDLSGISDVWDTPKVVSLKPVNFLLHGLGGCPYFRVLQAHTAYHGPENTDLYFVVQRSGPRSTFHV